MEDAFVCKVVAAMGADKGRVDKSFSCYIIQLTK